jgi:hypothetical protein
MTDGGGLHSTSLALSLGLLTGAAVALSRPSVERERDDLTTNMVAPRARMAPLASGLSLRPKWPSAKSPGLNQRDGRRCASWLSSTRELTASLANALRRWALTV